MSLAGHIMTMRARVERNQAPPDGWGGQSDPSGFVIIHDAIPCFIWVGSKREIVDGRKNVEVEDIVGVFPKDADISPRDRVTAIKDRNGKQVLPDKLEVDAVSDRSTGPSSDHKSVALRRHSA